MQQLTFYLNDESDTCELGKSLARVLESGLKIYLHGDLGSGKTTLTRALLKEAGHTGKVKSPTYTLVEPYVIELNGHTVDLLHFDLYRMSCPEEFLEAGFRDHFNEETVCFIEWAEKAESALPERSSCDLYPKKVSAVWKICVLCLTNELKDETVI